MASLNVHTKGYAMKLRILLFLAISGCNSTPNGSNNFNIQQFTEVSKTSMYKLNRTRPIDYESEMPLKGLEDICSQFNFSPEEEKTTIMNLLAEANYNDPMFANLGQGEDWTKMRDRVSLRQADLAYQACLNAYQAKTGMKTVLIKM